MHSAERIFLWCSGNKATKTFLPNNFIQSKRQFDKLLRSKERSFRRNKVKQIYALNAKDPRQFWDEVNNLLPCKPRQIPLKIQRGNDYITDVNDVLHAWSSDFLGLYNRASRDAPSDNSDDFYDNCMSHKNIIKNEMGNNFGGIAFLNENIRYDEVEKNILKLRRIRHWELMAYHLMSCKKDQPVWLFITQCFEYGRIPSTWQYGIISPIPKSRDKNKYVPLNYQSISLLSIFSKVYSSVLNTRLSNYSEAVGILNEEQNGFRKGRSCEEHAFVLSNVIRLRLDEKRNTFVSFIDFEKAFYWIDRDLLLYKLLLCSIDCKFYYAIKSLYNQTYAGVKLNGHISN